jgi:hypothetical protein
MDPEELDDEEKGNMKDGDTYYDKANRHNDASAKFNYYMAGVALAVLAFSLQTYKKPPTSWLTGIYVASWGFLLWSFMLWVGRIKKMLGMSAGVTLSAKNADLRKAVIKANEGGNLILDKNTMAPLSPEDRERLVNNAYATEANFKEQMDKLERGIVRRFNWGVRFMALGLLLQAVAKACEVVMEWKATAGK